MSVGLGPREKLLTVLAMVAFVGSGFAAFALVPSASVGHQGSAGPGAASSAMFHGTTPGTSSNWAGYAIKTGKGAVSDVSARWQVPQINAACPTAARYSSFWVGIDGDGSPTVEQIGTDTDCSGGSAVYYAWYEFYPNPSHNLAMTISPTNRMSADVHYSTSTGKFTLSIKDLTTGKSFSTSSAVSTAKRASAEWIAEAPSIGTSIQPLTNFGWVTFRYASATISGHTHSISGFSNIAITMWNTAGTKVMASVGGLTFSGTTFQVTWKSSGP
ncbi:MAG TPA: G1 family glutamic endopeptidase [Thermoplasmata archaeon]|nr:G1 family glutamic endopeptidase [Thermoplasmata archaeon]